MIRRRNSAAVLGLALALAASGCGQGSGGSASGGGSGSSGGGGSSNVKVAFVPKLQGVPYFEAMNAGGKKAARRARQRRSGSTRARRQADAAAQADIVRSFIQQKVDTLIVAPNDPDSMAPLLQQAKDAGIHVATADTDAPELRARGVRQPGHRRGHRRGADRRAAEGDGRQGQVRDRLLRPDGREPELLDRGPEGVHGVRSTRNAQIVDIVYAGEDQAKATQMATDLMNAHPDLTGLVGECTSSAPGVAQAVRDANKIGKVFTVGLGTPQSMKPYLSRRLVDARRSCGTSRTSAT